jgi:hypothetical protein
VRVKGAVDPHINYSVSFAEWEAASAAGLDLWKWEQNKYPKSFRAKVLAWYKLHNLVALHQQDSVAPKSNPK